MQYVYDSKESFLKKWTRIMEPFVPETILDRLDRISSTAQEIIDVVSEVTNDE